MEDTDIEPISDSLEENTQTTTDSENPSDSMDSPDEQELFYIDGETGALIRDAFGW